MVNTKQGITFNGKAFLFERALLCTEVDEVKSLFSYRTHIVLNDILYIDADKQGTFRVNLDDKEVDFSANKATVEKWIDLLTRTDDRSEYIRKLFKGFYLTVVTIDLIKDLRVRRGSIRLIVSRPSHTR